MIEWVEETAMSKQGVMTTIAIGHDPNSPILHFRINAEGAFSFRGTYDNVPALLETLVRWYPDRIQLRQPAGKQG
jgi:hypothetical protein